MSNLILGNDTEGTFSDAMSAVGSLCQEEDKPFVVIFDGINEHPDIVSFSAELEVVIERLINFPFVKVIVTCRSEYFSERFSNLLSATFSDSICQVNEIQRDMPERHRRQMVRAYFRFFNIKESYMSGKVSGTLESDPLILRFFCEAYGDIDATNVTMLPAMADIYREVVFKTYLDKKLNEVAARQSEGSSIGVPLTIQYKRVLRSIVSAMDSCTEFCDTPISAVETSLQPALAELIAEDVFVRKDLVAGKSVLDPDAEVINFTFDEFRDFLIADYLLNEIYEKLGEEAFTNKLKQYTECQCLVAEGVSRYVFYAAKNPGKRALLKIIATMPWYEETYLRCIFSVEEKCVSDDDLKYIKKEFFVERGKAQQVFFALMMRWDTAALPRLNIDLLFNILEEIGDSDYEKLVVPIFHSSNHSDYHSVKPPYPIEKLTSDIESLLARRGMYWDDRYPLCQCR